jgi:hypothetical protein
MNDPAPDLARLAATVAHALALADEAGEHLVGAHLSAARDALDDVLAARSRAPDSPSPSL